MEPAEPLPEKLRLDSDELNNESILLEHHSMLTPAEYSFSVLRTSSQNFQFRGHLWLTNNRLIYKGFFVTEMGTRKVDERLMKPYCDVDVSQPFAIDISISNITDLFMGHDSTFQKRFQRYPKLRVQFKSNGDIRAFYFYLTRENLIDDELYINKRCQEWIEKISEAKKKLSGEVSITAPSPMKATAAKSTPKIPTPPSPTAKPPTLEAPTAPKLGTDGILKEAVEQVEGKRYGKVVVKPLEEREKPQFTTLSTAVKSEEEETEPEFTKLLDTLIPVSDEEFSAAAADTSIAKCPHCGWILAYSTSKCPRCRKEI